MAKSTKTTKSTTKTPAPKAAPKKAAPAAPKKGKQSAAVTAAPAAPKAGKKVAAAPTPAKNRNGEPNDGLRLRKGHVAILTALASPKGIDGLTGTELVKATGVHPTMIGWYAGNIKPELNALRPDNLLNRGFVKLVHTAADRRNVYMITPAGRKAITTAK